MNNISIGFWRLMELFIGFGFFALLSARSCSRK
ncbi:hypothetical protein QF000_000523 [Paraburkholderia atlantica]